MKNKLNAIREELARAHDADDNPYGNHWYKTIEWLIETIENQQSEVDSLSMAHDAVHRELPKDKHTLIKSNIDKERTITSLRERAQELERANKQLERQAPGIELELLNMELTDALKQNKRYREVLEKVRQNMIGHYGLGGERDTYVRWSKELIDRTLEGEE